MASAHIFRLTSYATIAAAALALLISGGVGVYLTVTFAILMNRCLEAGRNTLAVFRASGARCHSRLAADFLFLIGAFLLHILQIQYLETGQHSATEVSVLAHLILFLSAV